jgi:hypothetical protein
VAERKYLHFVSVLALTALAVFAADDGKASGGAASADRSTPEKTAGMAQRDVLPPVLRNAEPADSSFVLLPGPAPARSLVEPPAPKPVSKVVAVAESHEPPPPELTDPGRPILHRAPRPVYPEDFEKDSGTFCQKEIGQWKEADALGLLGVPSGDRPAFDDNQGVNGRIYAFSDPTNRYRQLELDFDGETGVLRTVFVYPWKMTWQDCRRMWGGNVSAAEANKGRKFYSYLNRRLDVLVDASGKVISIGLY